MSFTTPARVLMLIDNRVAELGLTAGGSGGTVNVTGSLEGDGSVGDPLALPASLENLVGSGLEAGTLSGTWEGFGIGLQALSGELNISGYSPATGAADGAYLNGGWTGNGAAGAAGVAGGTSDLGAGGDAFIKGGDGTTTAGEVWLKPGAVMDGVSIISHDDIVFYDVDNTEIIRFKGRMTSNPYIYLGARNLEFSSSLGAAAGLYGASDQNLYVQAGAARSLLLGANGAPRLTLSSAGVVAASGTIFDLSTTGALCLGTGASDPRLVKEGTDGFGIEDGSGGAGWLTAADLYATSSFRAWDGATNTYVLGSSVGLGLPSGGKINFTNSAASASATIDTALSRDAAGRLLVENGSGTIADLRVSGVVFGTADTGGSKLVASGQSLLLVEGDASNYSNYLLVGSAAGNGAALFGGASAAANPTYTFPSAGSTGIFLAGSTTIGVTANSRPSQIIGHQVTLTDNTATTIATIALASGARCGGTVNWSVDVTDGTDHQVRTGMFTFSAVDKAGTLTSNVKVVDAESIAASTGTLTVTPTVLDGTNQISLQITADTSLTPTAMLVRFNMDLSGTSAAIVTLP